MSTYSTAGLKSKVTVTVVGECAICETHTPLRCQACVKGGKASEEIPFYCCRDHQLKHWKAGHKTNCAQPPKSSLGWKLEDKSPCPLSKNVPENTGYFVATEDLKVGHVLFQRKPLLAFPSLPFSHDETQFISRMPDFIRTKITSSKERVLWTCVGCYEVLMYGEIVQTPSCGLRINKCLTCGWPVHSHVQRKTHGLTKCESIHEEECAIFVEKGLTWDKLRKENVYADAELYYALGLLRAILLPPALKKEFMKLPVFAPQYFGFDITKIVPFVRDRCGFGNKFGEEEAKKIMSIIYGNIIPPTQRVKSKNKLAFIIYQGGPHGRVLTHDCIPNCALYMDNNLLATFKTTRNIESGQLLTMNYIMLINVSKPVNERVVLFAQLLMPLCSCNRCSSSTENGAFLSAIKCPVDKKSGKNEKRECQWLLPFPNPQPPTVGLNDIFVWKCACAGCTGASRQQAVNQLVITIREKIESAAAGPNPYKELKSLMAKTSGRTVHPNHGSMYYALHAIAATATREINNVESNQRPGGFPFNLHKKYLKDFDAVLERLQQIQPGRNDSYGFFLFYQTLLKTSQLAENVTSNNETKPSFEDLEKELSSLLWAMKESWLVFNDNPIFEPFDTAREGSLRKFYANHLISSIIKGYGSEEVLLDNKVDSFKIFKDKYYSPHPINLGMSKEEQEYRQLILINDSLPELLKKMKLVE